FSKMQEVLSHLEESSKATAKTMNSLQATTETMSGTLQKELALFYDPSVRVSFDGSTKKLNILNTSRTSLELWGSKIGSEVPIFLPRPHLMGPTSGYEFGS